MIYIINNKINALCQAAGAESQPAIDTCIVSDMQHCILDYLLPLKKNNVYLR